MILSDTSIKKALAERHLVIEPAPVDQAVQPASVDVRLSSTFRSPYQDEDFKAAKYYTLIPGECVLASTLERVEIPADLVARVEGKSSFGRLFLQIHSTAGFIDPGFKGNITLELTNLSKSPICLAVGEPIAQLSFQWVDLPVERPYGTAGLGSHYQNQLGVTPSAFPL